MLEELNRVIGERVKEVLQFHLNGTPEAFDAAAMAVMGELTSMGGSLQSIVNNGAGISSLASGNEEDRERLAEQLTQALNEN